jgi:hypothetical protein
LGKREFAAVIGDHRGVPDDFLYGRFREHDERRTACKSFQRLKSKSLVLRGLNAQCCACIALPQLFIRDPPENVKSPIDSGLASYLANALTLRPEVSAYEQIRKVRCQRQRLCVGADDKSRHIALLGRTEMKNAVASGIGDVGME